MNNKNDAKCFIIVGKEICCVLNITLSYLKDLLTLSLSLARTHARTLARTHALTHTHTHSHSYTHTHTHAHTHTHTHTHTLTHTHTHTHTHFPKCHSVYCLFMCCLLSQAGSLWFYQHTPLSVPDCIHSHIHMLYMHRRSLVEAARTAVQQKSKCSVSDSVNGDGCMYLTVLMPHTHKVKSC